MPAATARSKASLRVAYGLQSTRRPDCRRGDGRRAANGCRPSETTTAPVRSRTTPSSRSNANATGSAMKLFVYVLVSLALLGGLKTPAKASHFIRTRRSKSSPSVSLRGIFRPLVALAGALRAEVLAGQAGDDRAKHAGSRRNDRGQSGAQRRQVGWLDHRDDVLRHVSGSMVGRKEVQYDVRKLAWIGFAGKKPTCCSTCAPIHRTNPSKISRRRARPPSVVPPERPVQDYILARLIERTLGAKIESFSIPWRKQRSI